MMSNSCARSQRTNSIIPFRSHTKQYYISFIAQITKHTISERILYEFKKNHSNRTFQMRSEKSIERNRWWNQRRSLHALRTWRRIKGSRSFFQAVRMMSSVWCSIGIAIEGKKTFESFMVFDHDAKNPRFFSLRTAKMREKQTQRIWERWICFLLVFPSNRTRGVEDGVWKDALYIPFHCPLPVLRFCTRCGNRWGPLWKIWAIDLEGFKVDTMNGRWEFLPFQFEEMRFHSSETDWCIYYRALLAMGPTCVHLADMRNWDGDLNIIHKWNS